MITCTIVCSLLFLVSIQLYGNLILIALLVKLPTTSIHGDRTQREREDALWVSDFTLDLCCWFLF